MKLADLYVGKCQGLATTPHPPFLELLQHADETGEPLTELALNGNDKTRFKLQLDSFQVMSIVEVLQEASPLLAVASIDLSYNALSDTAAQSLSLLLKTDTMYADRRRITRLNLRGNDLTDKAAGMLADTLSSTDSALQSLDLSGNPLGDDGAILLAAMLTRNGSLRRLDIGDTRCGVKGVLAVSTALCDGNSTLEALGLASPLLPGPQYTTSTYLGRMLRSNQSLVELDLSHHDLRDSGLEELAEYGLLRNTSVAALSLSANKLSGFSAPLLERLISECPHLRRLDLSCNQLGDAGVVPLARALPYSGWLTDLDVRSNGVTDIGLAVLAEALSWSPHLRSVMLWGNAAGPAASSALRAALGARASAAAADLVMDVTTVEVDGQANVAWVPHTAVAS